MKDKSKVYIVASFLLGIVIGGVFTFITFSDSESYEAEIERIVEEKIITEKVVDTVVVRKPIYIDSSKIASIADSLVNGTDTLSVLLTEDLDSSQLDPSNETTDSGFDEEEEEELVIISDRLITKKSLTVTWNGSLEAVSEEEKLGRSVDRFSEVMTVEFWESPLELTGYELSKNRLKLFGFNPKENVELKYSSEGEYLHVFIGELSFHLEKTTRFKTLNF